MTDTTEKPFKAQIAVNVSKEEWRKFRILLMGQGLTIQEYFANVVKETIANSSTNH